VSKCLRSMIVASILLSASVCADDLMIVRSLQKFPEAMVTLQNSIHEHGYQITRVQRVDIGLTKKGYVTDKYRIVFVGKKDEIQYIISKYPQLIPFMPPKISVFSEGEHTIMVTANPKILAGMVDEKDKIIFSRWENDVYSVFDDIRKTE